MVTYLFNILNVPDTWSQIKPCDVLLVSHEFDHGFIYKEKSYSQLLYSLGDFLEARHFSLAYFVKPYSQKGRDDYYKGDLTANLAFLFLDILAFVGRLFGSSNRKRWRTSLRRLFWMAVLLKSKAQVVVAIQPELALYQAGYDLGVSVFELQHGVMTETIPSYNGQNALKEPSRNLPSGFLCWDQDSAEVVRTWAHEKGVQVAVVGNPWLARFATPKDKDSLVTEFNDEQERKGQSFPLRILITLQWSMSSFFPEYFAEDEFLRKEVLDLMAQTQDTVFWYVRMHPVQMNNESLKKNIENRLAGCKNVNIVWSTRVPLPVVLTRSQGHLTWDSSTVIEASALGIKSYVLNPGGFAYPLDAEKSLKVDSEIPYENLEKQGYVTRSPGSISMESIKKWITNLRGPEYNRKPYEFDTDLLVQTLKLKGRES